MAENDYQGNASLSTEVKQRVLTTFKQTLDLYYEGKLDEVVVGCDLILEMDHRFTPAEKLREKALDPGADIDVDALLPGTGGRSASPPVTPDFADEADAELLQAVEALNKRDFQTAIDVCNSILARFPDNEEAQKLGAKAFERMEAAPFVQQFVDQCATLIDGGNLAEARTKIEKARSLDPLHPRIKELVARLDSLETGGAAAKPPSAEPAGAGFDFGADSSPFAGAFGGSIPAPSTPAVVESSGFDAGASFPTPEEPAPTGFSTELPSEADVVQPDSFVVESPASVESATPGGAPAADFGFQFEEEASEAGGPSVPPASPGAPEAEVGQAHTFDFSTAAVEISAEDKQRVDQYLRDGDQAFARSQWQEAIDIWSRIFLIDVTNEDASLKIEQAKAKLRQADTQVEELTQLALTEFRNKDYQNARKHFEEVLSLDRDSSLATEHLEKLADLEAAMEAEAMAGSARITAPATAEPARDILSEDMLEEGFIPPSAPYREEEQVEQPVPRVPPPPAKQAPAPAPAKRKAGIPVVAIVAGVLVVVAAGGWFGYRTFFGGGAPGVDPAVTQAAITRAEALAAGGKYDEAIRLLGTIGPDDPMRQRSLELIAEYQVSRQQAAGTIGGRPRSEVFNEWIEKGRQAFEQKDFVAAKAAFEQAASIQELPPNLRQLYDSATAQVGKLTQASLLFQQGDYPQAISQLESLLANEPDNLNAKQMLADAHFNLGVTAIKEGRLQDAIAEFDTVLSMTPDDAEAVRNRDFASRYDGEPKDLLYRIYIKYLPLR